MQSNNLTVQTKNGVQFVSFKNIDASGSAVSAYTTKIGGVSEGAFSTMNFSYSRGDKREHVRENYVRLCRAAGFNEKRLAFSKQTHTVNIHTVKACEIGEYPVDNDDYNDIDGLITNIPGVTLVTQFADCVPLVFLDPVKNVIASSHAGWRGTVGEIGALTVDRMVNEFGCDKKDILVGIGPSVAKCCYEVDDLVMNELRKIPYINEADVSTDKGNGKYMLSLQETNRLILINAGINPENIDVSDICTHCHADVFHSHRKCGNERGNNAMFIMLK